MNLTVPDVEPLVRTEEWEVGEPAGQSGRRHPWNRVDVALCGHFIAAQLLRQQGHWRKEGHFSSEFFDQIASASSGGSCLR
jgi:hypothetical protein